MGATIAEILLEQGRQAADARRQQGAQSAATWTNLGNLIGSLPQQFQQAKQTQQANTLRDIQLKNAQDIQAGNQQVDTLMKPPAPAQGPIDPSGQGPDQPQNEYLDADGLWNIQKLTQALGAGGHGSRAPELLKGAEAINDSITKHKALETQAAQQHTILIGDLANGALMLSKNGGMSIPDAMDFVVQPALATRRISQQEYDQVKQKIAQMPPEQQPAALKAYMDQAELIAPAETLADKAQRVGRYGTTIAENAGDPNEGGYTINGQRFRKDGTPVGAVQPPQSAPKSYQKSSVLLDGKPAEVLTDPSPGGKTYDLDGKVIENAASRVKPIPSAAQVNITANKLTDAALDQAAQKYLDSGQLPSGMGGMAQRTAIQNRAAELDPKAALARNAATFKADSANLTNLQKTEGTLSAFENTAGKNLDQFLSLAEKIPDTGLPWLNTPVRSLSANVVGSANMAAINAARDVALREIARVTNDPKLSGALTDSARAEVLGLSPQNATLPQIKAVAKVLKQDMANVHSGLNEQIGSIKAAIGSNPAAPPQTQPNRIYYDANGNQK